MDPSLSNKVGGDKLLDQTLQQYKLAHRSVARYSLIFIEHVPVKKRTIISTGLEYEVCVAAAEKGNEAYENFYPNPRYSVQIENAEDASVNVRKVMAEYRTCNNLGV